MSLAQATVNMCLTKHETSNRWTKVKNSKGNAQQLTAGIAVRQSYRDKKIINLLHGFGLTVEHNRLLRLETKLVNGVVENIMLISLLILWKADIHFFAIDNLDFAEDTPDSQNTLDATAIAIYQQEQIRSDVHQSADLTVPTHKRSLQYLSQTITTLLEYKGTKSPTYPVFHPPDYQATVDTALLHHMAWLSSCIMVRLPMK